MIQTTNLFGSLRRQCLFWAFLLLTLALGACDTDKAARHFGPAANPSIVGEWGGTVTALYISGNDTLSATTFNTRFTFDDSTFSYRHIDDFGSVIEPYHGSGRHERADSTIYLQDTTTYSEWTDRTITPIIDEPYAVSLSQAALVMVWIHNYPQGIVRSQRIDLIRGR